MKILIDARMYGLENSGIGRYLINLIEELKKLKTENQFAILLRKKYFSTLKLPSNWIKILADYKHYTFEEQLKLPSIINKQNPDLVHFPHLNIPYFWKGKFVVTVHDLTMQRQGRNATTLPLPIYFIKRIPFLLIARKSVKGSVKIITPSDAVKYDVVDYYNVDKNKIVVTYEGAPVFPKEMRNATRYKAFKKYSISQPYLIYIGNAYPHKNLEKAIEAIKLLNQSTDRKVLLVIGGSKDIFKKRLEEKVKELEAEKCVRLLGYVADEDLGILYKNSIAFVYPSLSEGFGLQGLEAMASGCLVVASEIPVFKEIYEDNALYFNPKDVDSLIETVKEVMRMSEQERSELINKAKEFINKYSWRKMASETLDVYKQVLLRK